MCLKQSRDLFLKGSPIQDPLMDLLDHALRLLLRRQKPEMAKQLFTSQHSLKVYLPQQQLLPVSYAQCWKRHMGR